MRPLGNSPHLREPAVFDPEDLKQHRVRAAVRGPGPPDGRADGDLVPVDEDVLGDGVAFAGVAKYPARVKCALLGWMAFKDALAQASQAFEEVRNE